MATRQCLVVDVGKTNVKIHVLSERQESLAVRHRDNAVVESGPYPHADVAGTWDWMMEAFRGIAREFDVGALAVSTHGATAALVDPAAGDDGLVMPVLDYEWTGVDPPGSYGKVRPSYAETLSPGLPAGLNLGRQLYWQQSAFPGQFARARAILLYPQYWAWRLSGAMASEVSSLGCHTDLWSPSKKHFSSLVGQQGWTGLFPPLAHAADSIGTVSVAVSAATGLPDDCRVHTGVHDSNASLLRFLLAMPDDDFCLVSTGTWVICMATRSPVGRLDEHGDMLANVDVNGGMVPCIRFMGGREYAEICRRSGSEPGRPAGEGDIAAMVRDAVFVLPDYSGGSGPFGGRRPEIRGRIVNGNAAATLYCALMVDYCLERLQAPDTVIIAGSYLQNPLLCAIVAQLREGRPVQLSSDTAGTVRGTAQLTDWTRPVSVSLTTCRPSAIPGLDDYARTWRELAKKTGE